MAGIFALYIGQPIILFDKEGNQIPATIEGIDFIGKKLISERTFYNFEETKILLTPLAAITEEDIMEIGKMRGLDEEYFADRKTDAIGLTKLLFIEEIYKIKCSHSGLDIYQYLISKGYAIPLWFGIDHWANSKTALELGIGINKLKL